MDRFVSSYRRFDKNAWFVNDRFIALGATQIALSEDGISWNAISAPASFSSVAGNGTQYLAVDNLFGYFPRAWRSTNAVDWVSSPLSQQNIYAADLIFDGGTYAAVGYSNFPSLELTGRAPFFATSNDGVSWDIKHPASPGGRSLRSLISDEDGFLAVGFSGNVISISKTSSIIFRGTVGVLYLPPSRESPGVALSAGRTIILAIPLSLPMT